MGIVPAPWMPNCSMKRVITHWTAGGYKASSLNVSLGWDGTTRTVTLR